MSKVVRIRQVGGPEVLRWEDVDVGNPEAGQALIRQTAAGLNYIDTYFRTGLYPVPSLPVVLGMEGAGVVEAVGQGVREVSVGESGGLLHGHRRVCRTAAGSGAGAGTPA